MASTLNIQDVSIFLHRNYSFKPLQADVIEFMGGMGYILGGSHALGYNTNKGGNCGSLDFFKHVTPQATLGMIRECIGGEGGGGDGSVSTCNCSIHKIFYDLGTIFSKYCKNILSIPLQIENNTKIVDFRNNVYQLKSKRPTLAHSFGLQDFNYDNCFIDNYQDSVYRFCYNLDYKTTTRRNLRLKVILCTLIHHAQPNEMPSHTLKCGGELIKVVSVQSLASCMFHHLMNLKCEQDLSSLKWQTKFNRIYNDFLAIMRHLKLNDHAHQSCCNPSSLEAKVTADEINYFTSCPFQLIRCMSRSDSSNMGTDLHEDIFNLIDQIKVDLQIL